MPHELAPPSVVINNGGTVRNADVICEQPNGTRLWLCQRLSDS